MSIPVSSLIEKVNQNYDALKHQYGDTLGQKAPNTKKIKEKIDKIADELFSEKEKGEDKNKYSTGSLYSWKMSRDTGFLKLRNFIANNKLSRSRFVKKIFPFIRWVGAKQKKSADQPYVFTAPSIQEAKHLEKKVKLYNLITTICLVAGVILIGAGLLTPFLLVPVLFSITETAAAITITCFTTAGIVGTIATFATMFFSCSKAHCKKRIKTDPDFKYFIEQYVQSSHRLNHNLSKSQIMDKGLHNHFLKWKDKLNQTFDKYREKASKEKSLDI